MVVAGIPGQVSAMRKVMSQCGTITVGFRLSAVPHSRMRGRLAKEFDDAFASTRMPERPDYAWANEFLLKARMEMVK